LRPAVAAVAVAGAVRIGMARVTVISIEASDFGVACMLFVPNGTKQGGALVAHNCGATTVMSAALAPFSGFLQRPIISVPNCWSQVHRKTK